MKTLILATALLTSACAYHSPTAPSADPLPVISTPAPSPPPATPAPTTVSVLTIGIIANPPAPEKREAVTVTASLQGGRGPFQFAWAFGDGALEQGTSPNVTHRYAADGLKLIAVTATDADGRTAATSTAVTVKADLPATSTAPPYVPPAPTPTPAPTLRADLTCSPASSGSSTPCNISASFGGVPLASGQVTSVAWDFGDGASAIGGVTSSHVYAQPGTYAIVFTLTATTPVGVQSTSGFGTVRIQ